MTLKIQLIIFLDRSRSSDTAGSQWMHIVTSLPLSFQSFHKPNPGALFHKMNSFHNPVDHSI